MRRPAGRPRLPMPRSALEAAKLHDGSSKRSMPRLPWPPAAATRRSRHSTASTQRLNRSDELARRFAVAEKDLSNAAERRAASLVESEAATAEVQAAEEEERGEPRTAGAAGGGAPVTPRRRALGRGRACVWNRPKPRASRSRMGRRRMHCSPFPHDAIERLEALDIKIVGLRAAAEVGLPTLRMDYLKDVSGLVTMDRQPLPGGEDQKLCRDGEARHIRRRHADHPFQPAGRAQTGRSRPRKPGAKHACQARCRQSAGGAAARNCRAEQAGGTGAGAPAARRPRPEWHRRTSPRRRALCRTQPGVRSNSTPTRKRSAPVSPKRHSASNWRATVRGRRQ